MKNIFISMMLLFVLTISASASAVLDDTPTDSDVYEMVSNAGDDLFVTFGEDFTLDGCFSSFEATSICNMTDNSAFEFEWILDGEVVGAGPILFLSTGSGTSFETLGLYEIILGLSYDSIGYPDVNMPLIGGGTILLPGDMVLSDVFDSVNITISTTSAVPEPATWLMMIIGFGVAGVSARSSKRCIRGKMGTVYYL